MSNIAPTANKTTTTAPELFWQPQRAGERIIAICNYRDMVVVATNEGIYAIAEKGKLSLVDTHEIAQIKFTPV